MEYGRRREEEGQGVEGGRFSCWAALKRNKALSLAVVLWHVSKKKI
jgi:hypothetical protein